MDRVTLEDASRILGVPTYEIRRVLKSRGHGVFGPVGRQMLKPSDLPEWMEKAIREALGLKRPRARRRRQFAR